MAFTFSSSARFKRWSWLSLMRVGQNLFASGRHYEQTTVFEEIIRYFQQYPDVWFARHEELGRWALEAKPAEHSYQSRFF